jgi:drug/metabolite transporter (DMT)-like permease
MFFGMSFSLLAFFILRFGKPGVVNLDRWVFLNMLIPTVLEYVGQVMFLMANKHLTMALALTLKGSRVVFSAILVVLFLKRRLFAFHWIGAGSIVVGLIIASIPSMLNPKDKKGDSSPALGIALIIGSEFLRAFKGVYEERLLKTLRYDALMVIGLQGSMAFLLAIPTLFVVDAIEVDGKPLEDLSVTWDQYSSSPVIIGLSVSFIVTVPGLFVSGAYVTKLMSAVHNALTGSITNATVWLVSIVTHLIDDKRGDEVNLIHLVQLLGFIIVMISSLVYDSIIRIPGFFYPADRTEASGAGKSIMVDADHPAEVFLDYDIKEAANAIGIDETQLGEDTADENMTLLSDKPASSVETGEARRRN